MNDDTPKQPRIGWDEAVEIARNQLRLTYCDEYRMPEPEPVEHYRAYLRHDPGEYLPSGRLLELQRALTVQGDTANVYQHDELMLYAAAFLRERQALPPWLADFAADVIEGRRTRPRQHGQMSGHKRRRDTAVRLAMIRLVKDCGLPAYSRSHNPNADYFDAAEAIERAAFLEGLHGLSSSNIAKIWDRWVMVPIDSLGLPMTRNRND